MCGLAGMFFGSREKGVATVTNLNELQRHRGPDSFHLHEGDWFSIGHVRLAINGLGSAGDQPISSKDGRWLVVFNGEIYNHASLRRELGIDTSCTSDGAVIPELLAKGGPETLGLLRGMFAVLAVDLRERKVILAVDPFGIKPLYWAIDAGALVVASEVKALKKLLPNLTADPSSIATFLHRGAMSSNQSGIRGIHKVAPGQWLSVNANGVVAEGSLSINHLVIPHQSDWIEVERAFENSVQAHLLSDVPLALLLSDGVDSGAIAVAAARHGAEVTGITVDIEGSTSRREAGGAEVIAKELGMKHIVVEAIPDDWQFEKFISAMQRPTIDGLNTYLVTRAVKECGFKVALSGIGGDELLTGYANESALKAFAVLKALPPWLRPLASKLASPRSDLNQLNRRWMSTDAIMARVESAFVSFQRQVWDRESVFMATNAHALDWPTLPCVRGLFGDGHANLLSVMQFELYTAGQLLPDADAFSMIHGVELRVPFIDVALASSVASIANRSLGKSNFVEAFGSPYLKTSRSRPKQGFVLPMQLWMESGLLTENVTKLREPDSVIREWLDKSFVDDALRTWDRGKQPWHRVWSLVVLNEWLESL